MAYVLPIVISLGVSLRIDRKRWHEGFNNRANKRIVHASLFVYRESIETVPLDFHRIDSRGENRAKEKAKLRKGCIVLSATPEIVDHLQNTAAFMYVNVSFIVFDEADRVLDLGFEKDIEAILDIIDRTKKGGAGGIVVASIFTNDVIVGYVDARYGTFANENAKCGDSGRKP